MILFDVDFMPSLRACSPTERAAVRGMLGQLARDEVKGVRTFASNAPSGALKLRVTGRQLLLLYLEREDGDLVVIRVERLYAF